MVSRQVSATAWLDGLDPSLRAWLFERLEKVTLEAGQTLIEAGAPSDCLYVVTSGTVGAFAANEPSRLIGQVVAGETVGELGLISGKPRNATVRALRDSVVLRLSRETFHELTRADPAVVMSLARLVLERATQPVHERLTARPRTLAVLAQTEGLDLGAFVEQFVAALAPWGRATVVPPHERPTADALARLEEEWPFVLYVAEAGDAAWRRLCVRQADALVLVARADALRDGMAAPAPWSEVALETAAPMPKPEHLVLLHSAAVVPGTARAWQEKRPSAQVHHARGGPERSRDVARVARLIQGRGRALVLSGGGARGFAHLGVLRALEEAKVEIDAVGGTSIGAIIGAGYAADRSLDEMTEVYRSAFVAMNPLGDYTLPLVSLVGGRTVSDLLRRVHGTLDIEDLVRPFFSVATNLTVGQTVAHRRGPLWQWLRASCAIPGVLPPVFHQGHVFVDGGVMNNLPVDVMREGFAGEIIASDIGGDDAVVAPGSQSEFDWPGLRRVVLDWFSGFRRPSLLRLLLGSGMVNASAATVAARSAASVVIAPKMQGIDLLEWSAFDDAIARGYVAAREALTELGS